MWKKETRKKAERKKRRKAIFKFHFFHAPKNTTLLKIQKNEEAAANEKRFFRSVEIHRDECGKLLARLVEKMCVTIGRKASEDFMPMRLSSILK